jgi:hypothetical protein
MGSLARFIFLFISPTSFSVGPNFRSGCAPSFRSGSRHLFCTFRLAPHFSPLWICRGTYVAIHGRLSICVRSTALYHSVVGFFRDDTPLMELILDEKGQKEINRLWDEFDFIANFTVRTWTQYFFNQSGEVEGKGAESGSPRPADHQITDTPVYPGVARRLFGKGSSRPDE